MAEKRCGNPACTCVSEKKDKFCSAHCEALQGAVETICQCGHSSCHSTATKNL
jgi:hypothetical protein